VERRATKWNRSKEPVWGGLEEEVCLWRNTTDDNLFVIETDSSAAELSGAVAAVVCEMIMVNTMSCLVSWSYCWRSNCSLRKQRHLAFRRSSPRPKQRVLVLYCLCVWDVLRAATLRRSSRAPTWEVLKF